MSCDCHGEISHYLYEGGCQESVGWLNYLKEWVRRVFRLTMSFDIGIYIPGIFLRLQTFERPRLLVYLNSSAHTAGDSSAVVDHVTWHAAHTTVQREEGFSLWLIAAAWPQLSGALNCGSLSCSASAHPNQPAVEVISQDRGRKEGRWARWWGECQTKKQRRRKRDKERETRGEISKGFP